jgi:hypothetical protein
MAINISLLIGFGWEHFSAAAKITPIVIEAMREKSC